MGESNKPVKKQNDSKRRRKRTKKFKNSPSKQSDENQTNMAKNISFDNSLANDLVDFNPILNDETTKTFLGAKPSVIPCPVVFSKNQSNQPSDGDKKQKLSRSQRKRRNKKANKLAEADINNNKDVIGNQEMSIIEKLELLLLDSRCQSTRNPAKIVINFFKT